MSVLFERDLELINDENQNYLVCSASVNTKQFFNHRQNLSDPVSFVYFRLNTCFLGWMDRKRISILAFVILN